MFSPTKYLIVNEGTKYKDKFRIIKKWFINKNTPVGEPADFYEAKPYGGKKYIPNPIAEIKENGCIEFDNILCFKAEYDDSFKYLRSIFVAPNSLIDFIANLPELK